jgi:hypothetical protein
MQGPEQDHKPRRAVVVSNLHTIGIGPFGTRLRLRVAAMTSKPEFRGGRGNVSSGSGAGRQFNFPKFSMDDVSTSKLCTCLY